jgi:hypothetical protein
MREQDSMIASEQSLAVAAIYRSVFHDAQFKPN